MSSGEGYFSMMSTASEQEEQKKLCDQFLAEEQQRALIASQHKAGIESALQGDLDEIASKQ